MDCSEEERLVQMVRDFIESEPFTPLSQTLSKALPISPKQDSHLSLQEILGIVTDAEIEVLEKILVYLKDLDALGRKANNLKKWIFLCLQRDGFDVSLCQTSWITPFGPPAGGEPRRLIIDVDFRSQFELARPTPIYKELVSSLPSIFVGTEEKLNNVISLLCSAAKQSLKENGLHVPPWRKASYMHSKWLSDNCKKVSHFLSGQELGNVVGSKCEHNSGNVFPSTFHKWNMHL